MKFENTFAVDAPIDEVYAALLDVERVAPCVPGAEVLERTGEDAYKVAIKVRVGPISMQYRGDVEIVERDESAHQAVWGRRGDPFAETLGPMPGGPPVEAAAPAAGEPAVGAPPPPPRAERKE